MEGEEGLSHCRVIRGGGGSSPSAESLGVRGGEGRGERGGGRGEGEERGGGRGEGGERRGERGGGRGEGGERRGERGGGRGEGGEGGKGRGERGGREGRGRELSPLQFCLYMKP